MKLTRIDHELLYAALARAVEAYKNDAVEMALRGSPRMAAHFDRRAAGIQELANTIFEQTEVLP